MAIRSHLDVYAGADGNQLQAAGALIFARDTGNVLVVYRSPDVVDPCVWCGVGGKIEQGETAEQACIREVKEEVSYLGKMELRSLFTWDKPDLKFSNFLGIVDKQFHPILNWETAGYVWCKPSEIPEPTHYGLEALGKDNDSLLTIQQVYKEHEHTPVLNVDDLEAK